MTFSPNCAALIGKWYDVVEWLGQNPDWFGVKRERSLIYLDSCLKISFSIIFAILLIMEIDL